MFEPMQLYENTGKMIAYLMSRGYSLEELEPKGFWEKYSPFSHSIRISKLYLRQLICDFYMGNDSEEKP